MKRLIGTWQEKAALKFEQPWHTVLPRFSSRAGAWLGLIQLLPSTASAWQGWQDLQSQD